MTMSTMRPAGTMIAAALTLIVIGGTPAIAHEPHTTSENGTQTQIDSHLREFPGGKQISPNEISYAGGEFVMSFAPSPGVQYGADCPAGWFCFYEFTNFGYPRGKLSSCGWQDLLIWGWHDRTSSVHYNLPTGAVTFLNHGAQVSHSYDTALFSVDYDRVQQIADVSPYRDKADHVRRYC